MHRLRDQSGQALVEFAIILPIVMLILLGVIDFGLAFNSQNDEANLANTAIRLADVNLCQQCNLTDGNAQIVKYIAKQADTKQLANNGLTICFFNPSDPSNSGPIAAGQPLEVRLSSNFRWLHYAGLPVGTTNIVAKVTGRLEQPFNASPGDTYALNQKYDSDTGTITADVGCA